MKEALSKNFLNFLTIVDVLYKKIWFIFNLILTPQKIPSILSFKTVLNIFA